MKIAGIYAVILLLIVTGCTESTTVGGEILDQDQSALLAIDTFTIRAATVSEENLVIYSPALQLLGSNLCGHLEDPVFGTVKADFYAQFRVNENAFPVYPDTAVIDSLVLYLEYDLNGIYGDSLAEQEFEVYRITGDVVDRDSFYVSGNELPTNPTPLATIRFTPNFEEGVDSSIITQTSPDTTYATINPFLSIPLPNELGTELMTYADDDDPANSAFLTKFGGLAIRPVSGPTRSMLSFDIEALRTGLQLHYHLGEGEDNDRLYEYNITTASVRFSSFDNNPAADIVAAEADGFEAGKERTYIQGMNGPSTLLQLPYITNFKDEVVVNNAELTVTVQPDPEDNLFPPVTQIIILYKTAEGNFVTIDDFLFTANGAGLAAFGGQPETFAGDNGETLQRYRMKISAHLQEMISGELPNEIYLRIFQKNERANRVILYGTDHPQYPVTLNANFTNLN